MGLVYSNIVLKNPVLPNLASLETKCLVNMGSTYLCIPPHIANQLKLKTLQKREVTLANGHSKMALYVGPIQVNFENRICFVGAMVLGGECLLGAIPMDDMLVPIQINYYSLASGDLIVHPKLLKLSVNPENPNFAQGIAKGLPKKNIH
jgi:clan AA aspartic protease